MNRQRLHLKIGIRYIELQLGLLIGFGIIAAPNKVYSLIASLVGVLLGFLVYKRTQAHVKMQHLSL